MDQKVSTVPVNEQLNWFAERLLSLLSSMAAAGNADKASRFRTELSNYKNQLAHPVPGESVDVVARKCLALCQDYFEQGDTFRLNHHSEYAAIIDVLRQAITSLVEERQCDGMVISSAQRFRDLVAMEDIHDLKRRIETEAVALEQTIRERAALHERTISALTNKVHGLEQKLSRTRKQLTDSEAENSLDTLTKVSNRRQFDQQLERRIHACKQSGQFVLAMLDIDNFKSVNDDFGHQVGDKVLHDVAQCIRSMVRGDDVVARYGGEEFALLLLNIDAERAEQRCNKILEAIRNERFECHRAVSISCGLTEFVSGDVQNDLLLRADAALYQAKKNGKDRVEIRQRPRGPSWLSSLRKG